VMYSTIYLSSEHQTALMTMKCAISNKQAELRKVIQDMFRLCAIVEGHAGLWVTLAM